MLYGLIGFPLSHSFSQTYFTRKFAGYPENNRPVYQNFPLKNISEVTHLLQQFPLLCGLNVTIPYKEQIIPFLDKLSEEAASTGAVNTVRILRDQRTGKTKLIGYNTDISGFKTALDDFLDKPVSKALVLGTGGASKAVTYVLHKRGISYKLISRRPSAEVITYDQLSLTDVHEAKLIINTTPLGMFPEVNALPDIPYEAIGSDHFLFDLVYNPAETMFLKEGIRRSAKVTNGSKMLTLQAEASWKIWNSDS